MWLILTRHLIPLVGGCVPLITPINQDRPVPALRCKDHPWGHVRSKVRVLQNFCEIPVTLTHSVNVPLVLTSVFYAFSLQPSTTAGHVLRQRAPIRDSALTLARPPSDSASLSGNSAGRERVRPPDSAALSGVWLPSPSPGLLARSHQRYSSKDGRNELFSSWAFQRTIAHGYTSTRCA